MQVEFKRQQNLEWTAGDVIVVEWEGLGKKLFFIGENNTLFDPKTGEIIDFDYGDYTMMYYGKQKIEVLEVFKNKDLTLMLG